MDAFASNVDRTARNPNLLLWQRELWLIDHGAALYWHHDWDPDRDRTADPSRSSATTCCCAGRPICPRRTPPWCARLRDEVLAEAVAQLPDELLDGPAAVRHRPPSTGPATWTTSASAATARPRS